MLEEVVYDTVYLMFSLNAKKKLRSSLTLWIGVMYHVQYKRHLLRTDFKRL